MGSPCESRTYGMNVAANQTPVTAISASSRAAIRRNQNRACDGFDEFLACDEGVGSVDSGAAVELVTFAPLIFSFMT